MPRRTDRGGSLLRHALISLLAGESLPTDRVPGWARPHRPGVDCPANEAAALAARRQAGAARGTGGRGGAHDGHPARGSLPRASGGHERLARVHPVQLAREDWPYFTITMLRRRLDAT